MNLCEKRLSYSRAFGSKLTRIRTLIVHVRCSMQRLDGSTASKCDAVLVEYNVQGMNYVCMCMPKDGTGICTRSKYTYG